MINFQAIDSTLKNLYKPRQQNDESLSNKALHQTLNKRNHDIQLKRSLFHQSWKHTSHIKELL